MTPRTIRRLKPMSLPPPVRLLFVLRYLESTSKYIQKQEDPAYTNVCMYPSTPLSLLFTLLLDDQANNFAAVRFPTNS